MTRDNSKSNSFVAAAEQVAYGYYRVVHTKAAYRRRIYKFTDNLVGQIEQSVGCMSVCFSGRYNFRTK